MGHPLAEVVSSLKARAILRTSAFATIWLLLTFAVGQAPAQQQRPALVPEVQGGTGGNATAMASTLSNNMGELSDEPISAGDTVHVLVFGAPDFSVLMRVSADGDIAVPAVGIVHLAGLNSEKSADLISAQLKKLDLMPDPRVIVTVDSASSAITILGEVRNPGIYPPPAKHLLSDVLATAGGLTATSGRVIEISNDRRPERKIDIPWDPTMHNTANYDRNIVPGDRVLVRSCGIAYIGGDVAKPGAYSLCGSPKVTLSELLSLAGGATPMASESHTFLVRAQADGTKVAEQIDIHKVLTSKTTDPVVQEDDIVYVAPSTVKEVTARALSFALAMAGPLVYVYQP
ncbi:MAG TPA: SLBB domain-containing protein [Terracidiphilus sp.]|nr:SLBB domain-containing protein [Terracidiphilus sp.]